MRQYAGYGYISGFGRSFDLRYRVVRGIATGPARVVRRDRDTFSEIKHRFDARLAREPEARKSFADALARTEDHGLAVLEWRWLGKGAK